jgi:hypothetical protein
MWWGRSRVSGGEEGRRKAQWYGGSRWWGGGGWREGTRKLDKQSQNIAQLGMFRLFPTLPSSFDHDVSRHVAPPASGSLRLPRALGRFVLLPNPFPGPNPRTHSKDRCSQMVAFGLIRQGRFYPLLPVLGRQFEGLAKTSRRVAVRLELPWVWDMQ